MFAHRVAADGLFRLQARRIQELSGLAQIAEIIQSTADPDRLFGGFTRGLRQVVTFDELYVARIDGEHIITSKYGADGRSVGEDIYDGEVAQHPWFRLRGPMNSDGSEERRPAFCSESGRVMHVVPLRPKEFELLEYLLRNEGQVVSRESLARDVWRETARSVTLDNVMDVHIARLRRKIDFDHPSKLISTVRGVGFVIRESAA